MSFLMHFRTMKRWHIFAPFDRFMDGRRQKFTEAYLGAGEREEDRNLLFVASPAAATFGFFGSGALVLKLAPEDGHVAVAVAVAAACLLFFGGIVFSLVSMRHQRLGPPERIKPSWLIEEERKRESAGEIVRHGRGWIKTSDLRDYRDKREEFERDSARTAEVPRVDEINLADPTGSRAVYDGVGVMNLKVGGYRLTPLVVQIENYSSCLLEVKTGPVGSAADRWLAVMKPGVTQSSVVLDDRELADGELLPDHNLQIRTSGKWRVTIRTVEDLRTFEDKVTGTGFDVIHYAGPPGIAVIRQEGATPFSLQLRDANLSQKRSVYHVLCPLPEEKGRVALRTGSVLQIGAEGEPWLVEVNPLIRQEGGAARGRAALKGPGIDELRTFSTSITGNTAEVLFYTGPSGRFRIEHGGDGPFGIDRLNSNLDIAKEILTTSGPHQGEVELRTHSLLQIRGGAGTWSLQQINPTGQP